MITVFTNNVVLISSSGPVSKSEDGQNYSFLFNGGEFVDNQLCLPSKQESANYYFYSGDGVIQSVACKTY